MESRNDADDGNNSSNNNNDDDEGNCNTEYNNNDFVSKLLNFHFRGNLSKSKKDAKVIKSFLNVFLFISNEPSIEQIVL